jgi:hypothetical protein
MSDTESREQQRASRHATPPDEPGNGPRCAHAARSEPRSPAEPVSAREQARLADLQRCIDSMRKVAGDLDARVADLECSVGRIGSAFGQMAGLHDVVMGGASRGRSGGYVDRGGGGVGRRDFYNRQDPPRGDHRDAQPPFSNGGAFNGRGRGRRA